MLSRFMRPTNLPDSPSLAGECDHVMSRTYCAIQEDQTRGATLSNTDHREAQTRICHRDNAAK